MARPHWTLRYLQWMAAPTADRASSSRLRLLIQQTPPAPDREAPARALPVELVHRDQLVGWVSSPATPARVAMRSALILLAAAGWTDVRIAAQVGVSRRTVAFWKARYRRGGAHVVLMDAPGRGRKPGRDAARVARILSATREQPPLGPRWTVRMLARAVGVSHATVQRVWREHGLTPPSRL